MKFITLDLEVQMIPVTIPSKEAMIIDTKAILTVTHNPPSILKKLIP